jgi:hypothetical protein
MSNNADRIAKLEAEVEALKAAQPKPQPKPFVEKPYQRYDPTAGMSMPPSALRAMVDAVPDRLIKEIVRDNQAPLGPTTERKP